MTNYIINLSDSLPISESFSYKQTISVDTFYSDLLSFFQSIGITPIVLLTNIKAIDYYRLLDTFILIPKSLTVSQVWNGYIYEAVFSLVAGSRNVQDFRTMKNAIKKLIGVNLYNGNIYLVLVDKQTFDTGVKGFYREFYDISVKQYAALT